jgi:hypothetical protein
VKKTSEGVPPVTPKSIARENLAFGQPANLGKDGSARYTSNYGKKQPVDNSEDVPLMGY